MLNFSPQIPAESTDLVDSASDGPADDGQVQKCQQLNIIFSLWYIIAGWPPTRGS
jgi:hypothetical protein